MRAWSGRCVVVLMVALAAERSAAQEPELAGVLARFPDDGMPALLARLHGKGHVPALAPLHELGHRAHLYLLGALRCPAGSKSDLRPAFGGFGPGCRELLPVLLALLEDRPPGFQARYAAMVVVPLLRALGPAARPAVPVLRKLNERNATQLADELAAGPAAPPAPPAEAVRVDERWCAPLLGVLQDRQLRASWWPALQALMAADERTLPAAASALLAYALEDDDAPASEAARDLLTALRYRCAATAMDAFVDIAALPPELRLRELRCRVLAWRQMPFTTPDEDAAIAALRIDPDPEVRRVMVVEALLQSAFPPMQLPGHNQSQLPLSAWLQDPDAEVRQLAGRLERVRTRAATAVVAQTPAGAGDDPAARVQALEALGDDQLRHLTPAQVRELLALAEEPQNAAPQVSGDIVQDVLRAAERGRSQGGARWNAAAVLARLVGAAPALLMGLGELTQAERRTLLAAVARARSISPELHGWLLDQVELPPAESPLSVGPLPIVLLPALRTRLREGRDPDRTVALLRHGCRYQDWADASVDLVDDLAALVPRLSPAGCAAATGVLAMAGERGRRAQERLVLEPGLSAAARAELAKGLSSNLERVPPSAAFVVKLLEHDDAELKRRGASLAAYVRDDRDGVAAILLRLWPDADAKLRSAIAMACGRMRMAAAVPLLAAELEQRQGAEQIDVAVALLDIDEKHAAAGAALTRVLDSGDEKLRGVALQRISFSPGASARFLERAVADLETKTTLEWPEAWRLARIVETAAGRRHDEAVAELDKLQRHRENNVRQFARQALERLRNPQHR